MDQFFADVDGVVGMMTHLPPRNISKQHLLDDKVWSEDPIPDRQLCIHETPNEPNHQCSYPCPYRTTCFRIDLPQSTPQDAAVFCYEQMDISDISSDLPDIMMTNK